MDQTLTPRTAEVLNASFRTYRLLTLDALDACWNAMNGRYPFVCEGMTDAMSPAYLPPYQWVFGETKAAAMRGALSIAQSSSANIRFQWMKDCPGLLSHLFDDWRNHPQNFDTHDFFDMESLLSYWKVQRKLGGVYYGQENELDGLR